MDYSGDCMILLWQGRDIKRQHLAQTYQIMWCSEAVEFLTDLQSGTTYVREVSYFLILLIKTNISVNFVELFQI